MRRIIKLGDTGEDVKKLQAVLGLKQDRHEPSAKFNSND